MIQPNSSKKFIFNENIDSDYLYSLYEDDYQYIEEIFATTLTHFDGDLATMQEAYAAGDAAALKKAVHKIKPTFGFVGLTSIQQLCAAFEDICQKVTSTGELRDQYQQIVATLAANKDLIASEYSKLKEFNSNL
jgi:HPt (histidine-containing phosphotransfer) domain-containing protein